MTYKLESVIPATERGSKKVRSLIGKRVFYADDIASLENKVLNGTNVGVLTNVLETAYPFTVESVYGTDNYQYIYLYEDDEFIPFDFRRGQEYLGRTVYNRERKEVRTLICVHEDSHGVVYFGDLSAKDLLKHWMFSDGTTCGLKTNDDTN